MISEIINSVLDGFDGSDEVSQGFPAVDGLSSPTVPVLSSLEISSVSIHQLASSTLLGTTVIMPLHFLPSVTCEGRERPSERVTKTLRQIKL